MIILRTKDVPPELLEFFTEISDHQPPDVLTINPAPYKGAHFACWPPKLVEPMIKAGSSEKGCCPKCGSPQKRISKKEYKIHENWFGDKQDARHSRGKAGKTYKEPVGINTIGWEPTCSCNLDVTVPCTVLDPFSGSATTGMVALQLGRNYIGIDLNVKYLKLAEARIRGEDAPQEHSDSENTSIEDLFGG